MKAILLGLLASFFFAVTFVLNRIMSDGGGSWIWSASLRYFFMLPLLLIIVLVRRNIVPLFTEMNKHPWQWLLWSFVGFGLFYAPLCFAAAFSPAWLVAGTWQFTIIAGSLLVPFFYETVKTDQGLLKVRRNIPFKNMGMSLIILAGIIIMEVSQASKMPLRSLLLGIFPVLIATFAYPLGNRKMMALCEGRLDAYQRTLGMTIASLPLWVLLSLYQFIHVGLPSRGQTYQSLIVALFSGVIATVLFFTATDLAQDVQQLAIVEATQSGEVVFTWAGERLLIPGTAISAYGAIGLCFVVIGMVLHSLQSAFRKPARQSNECSKISQR
ncbi:multidrug resistance efflux transporter family protein [Pullulanibacillus sp. KACC 23026]|uniref:DMT family transporter n=1 Tax=Pullulanibacillus sp. KACC 23026 TaxID=3028315 RepID=UPI0023AF4E97|nr:multidrug resistance efflux transporter family protein [Pullulanibacillus sp. KACC 23026]WEG14412.1 multidrug resistance efflux transporter family protein [Pullulanibacillus sp. KACC 23026]